LAYLSHEYIFSFFLYKKTLELLSDTAYIYFVDFYKFWGIYYCNILLVKLCLWSSLSFNSVDRDNIIYAKSCSNSRHLTSLYWHLGDHSWDHTLEMLGKLIVMTLKRAKKVNRIRKTNGNTILLYTFPYIHIWYNYKGWITQ